MKRLILIGVVAFVLLGAGCSSAPMRIGAQEVNAEFARNPESLLAKIETIHRGMDEADVYKALGFQDKQSNLIFLDAVGVQQAMCGNCRFDPKTITELKEHEAILAKRTGRRFIATLVDKYVSIRGTTLVEQRKGTEMGIVMVFENKKLVLMRPDGNPHLETSESLTLFGLLYDALVKKGLIGFALLR